MSEKKYYGVQVFMSNRWLMAMSTTTANANQGQGKWFESRDMAEKFMEHVRLPQPRIVTCRMTPAEVIK